ncbi:MAG: PEP-CTERM sorting domain-containing protein [Akkermansiaceae bacterium]
MMKLKYGVLTGALCTLIASNAGAAMISWGSGVSFSGDTDVDDSGATVFAINGAGANVTINGVSFTGSPTGTSAGGYTIGDFYTKLGNANGAGTFDPNGTPSGGAGTGPYDALSADYKNFTSSAMWPGNPNTALPYDTDTVTMSNLNIGDNYLVQIWTYDGRNGRSGHNFVLDGDASNPIRLNDDPYVGDGSENAADGIGQYVIGTFTADAATQSFDIEGFAGNGGGSQGRAQINAIQLRNLSVPEPSSMLLTGLAALGFMGRRRR